MPVAKKRVDSIPRPTVAELVEEYAKVNRDYQLISKRREALGNELKKNGPGLKKGVDHDILVTQTTRTGFDSEKIYAKMSPIWIKAMSKISTVTSLKVITKSHTSS